MNPGDGSEAPREAAPAVGALAQPSVGPEAAAQWAQSMAGMQALYKQGQPAAPPFMPPNQLAAYYANAAQFSPLLYNVNTMMNGLGGMSSPYAFMPPALPQQAKQLAAPSQEPSQTPSIADGRDTKQHISQDGGLQKRHKSAGELKGDPVDGSGSQSPASEPGSDQPEPAYEDAMLRGDSDPAAQLVASGSGHNLGLSGGMGLQDEREVKKLRRKQSNRESARRSRLRKQAECEALSGKVLGLEHENLQLKEANRALLARVEELVAKLEQATGSTRPPEVVATAPDDPMQVTAPVAASQAQLPSSDPSQQTTESGFATPEIQAVPAPDHGNAVTC